MRFTLGKKEKLKSKKAIEMLFEKGSRVKSFPLQVVYLRKLGGQEFPVKVGFSVPKRTVKKAVKRNEIRRVLRAVFRLQKSAFLAGLLNSYDMMFIYTAKEKMDYSSIEVAMEKLRQKLLIQIAEDEK